MCRNFNFFFSWQFATLQLYKKGGAKSVIVGCNNHKKYRNILERLTVASLVMTPPLPFVLTICFELYVLSTFCQSM